MKIVDANVLLYAVNTTSEHHKPSLRWLDGALSGADRVGFAWVPLLAFVRLATKVGLFPRPLPREAAITQVADWLAAPSAVLVNPTVRHADILARMLTYVGTGANLVNDAHLAALASSIAPASCPTTVTSADSKGCAGISRPRCCDGASGRDRRVAGARSAAVRGR